MSGSLCVSSWPCFLVAEGVERRPDSLDGLLDCARGGDAHAFQRMRQRFEPALVNFVRGYVRGDEDTALDLVQETFTVAWHKLDQIRDGAHLKPWLYRVARFKAISFLRRRGPRGRPMHSIEFAAEHGADYPDPNVVDPLRHAITRDAPDPWVVAVRRALPRLPPLYVAVMRLYYMEHLDTRQIALLLELPRTTVKMRLMRGRRRLKALVLEEMAAREDDEPPGARAVLSPRPAGGARPRRRPRRSWRGSPCG